MEQPKEDEDIVCASCGVTFVFTAAAAAARAERGNTTKPTMCKSCWRAKASNNERRNADAPARSPARPGRAAQRPNQPSGWGYRSTGDVNEYRSPMPDPHFGGPSAQPARGWGQSPAHGDAADGATATTARRHFKTNNAVEHDDHLAIAHQPIEIQKADRLA